MSVIRDSIKRQFNHKNVGIEEFATSEAYCGKPCYPRQIVLLKLLFLEEMNAYEEDILSEWQSGRGEVYLSPETRARRDWLRENGYKHFPEVMMVGGRRSSKGFITSIALAKLLYESWKLGDPSTYYGIDTKKAIHILCVAASMEQAKEMQYADVVGTVTGCKSLPGEDMRVQEESLTIPTSSDMQYMLEMKNRGIKVGRNFAKLRVKPVAANADTIRGHAALALVFDEMAFMMEGESRSSAEAVYAAATPALAQFGKDAMIFLNSSPYSKVGKFYDRWVDSRRVDEETGAPRYPTLMSVQFPSWELYKDYARTGHRKALMVSPDWDPTKLNSDDAALCIEARFDEEANPEKFKVEKRGQWAEVVDAFLRPEKVDEAFVKEYGGKPILMNTVGGTYEYQYKGHADPSTTTAGFGFAIAHVEMFDSEPHVVFDVVQRWDPRSFEGHTIDQLYVLDEISLWIEKFRPYEFTFDQFNSHAPIQWLRQRLLDKRIGNIRIGETTATRQKNWDRWQVFRTALNMGLVHIPNDCPDAFYASQELKFLQEKNGKVDKQDLGPVQTKDIADCIAEVTFSLLNSVIGVSTKTLGELGIVSGSRGGYQIGGRNRESLGGSNSVSEFYRNRRQGTTPGPARGIQRGRRGY